MAIIALTSLRGGTGVTSTAAALAHTLQQLQESVLVIDFSPHNLLALHFNTTATHQDGWARAVVEGRSWHRCALHYGEGLAYLPFGVLNGSEHLALRDFFKQSPNWWDEQLARLSLDHYRWILLDCPPESLFFSDKVKLSVDNKLSLLNADAACHALLHQAPLEDSPLQVTSPHQHHYLLNKYLSHSQLQQDLHRLWVAQLPSLLPFFVHQDEAMAEALAAKQPVGDYAPLALVTQEINVLANWLLIQRAEDKT